MKEKVVNLRFKIYNNTWNEFNIGNITDSFSGGTPNSSNKEFYSGDIPFIRSGEIKSTGTELYISREALEISSAKLVKKGDILFALYGATSGEVAISKIDGAINQAILALKPIEGFDAKFLESFFVKEKQNILDKYLQGGQGNLSGSIIKNISLRIPEYSEQQSIGSLFRTLDDLLLSYKENLANYQDYKATMLSKMFPKEGEKEPEIRLDGFEGEWEKGLWKDEIIISTNMVDPKNEMYSNLPHIAPGNIESFTGRILENVKFVKDENLISGKFKFSAGDVIFGKINPQLGKYFYASCEGLTSSDAYVLNSKGHLDQRFIFCLIQTKHFFNYSVSVSRRTGMPKINRDELNSFKFLMPNIKEQYAIGKFFFNLDKIITSYQVKISELENLKKKLLKEMFI